MLLTFYFYFLFSDTIILFAMNKQSLTKSLIDSLHQLNTLEFQHHNFIDCGKQFFEACYLVGKLKTTIELPAQKQIANLVKVNIKKLDNCIYSLGSRFDSNHAPSLLIYRSGIQFLLDNFLEFPITENERLEKILLFLRESEAIEEFDQALENWKNYPSGGWESTDHKREVLQRPSNIPESHIWWL